MRRAEIITAVLMAAFSAYLMYKSTALPIGWITGEGPGGGFWPFWLAALMLLSTIWIVVNWYRRTSPPSQSEDPYMDDYAKKMFVLVGGGVTVMIGLVEIIGMHLATAVFLVYYIRFIGGHTWRTTLSIAVPTPIITFFFFDVGLRKFLPTGMLDSIYIPLYGKFL
ncbi:MAG: tripartite tricarboxylate transporter TctB family protein [Rhodospirillaceae bacterium]